MKILLSTLTLAVYLNCFAQLTGNSQELAANDIFRTPMSSGKITYIISGEISGLATLYFDRNGWRQLLRKEISIEKYGMKTVETTVQFMDGDYNYVINVKANRGTQKIDNRWSKLAAYKPKDNIARILLEDDGGVYSSDTTLLDRPISMWEFDQATTLSIWVWKGIELKEYRSLVGMKYEMTATEIEENITFPEDLIPHSAIIAE